MALVRVLLVLLAALPFAHGMMDCAEMGRMCVENACFDSGGEYSGEACVQGEGFDLAYYQNATAECELLVERCEESGGFMVPPRNMGCCGPAFVLLAVLGFAAGSRFK